MPLRLNSSGGGSVTLDTPSTASTFTLTVPAITGTAVVTGSTGTVTQGMLAANVAATGPAFYAYQSGAQGVGAGVFFKIILQTEVVDIGNCFDNVTNWRFQPSVAGLYMVGCGITRATSNCDMSSNIYKNGTTVGYGNTFYNNSAGTSTTSKTVYLNGSTDYVEFYGYFSIAQNTVASEAGTYGFGYLVRAI